MMNAITQSKHDGRRPLEERMLQLPSEMSSVWRSVSLTSGPSTRAITSAAGESP